MNKFRLVAIAALAFSPLAMAHHSAVQYDFAKLVEIKGTVKQFSAASIGMERPGYMCLDGLINTRCDRSMQLFSCIHTQKRASVLGLEWLVVLFHLLLGAGRSPAL